MCYFKNLKHLLMKVDKFRVMAPFSIPTPCILPCPLPILGGPKSINTSTKIELLCDTAIKHEIFYTLDGTKPQPYSGIVQGSKLFKYSKPFCLPAGKITVKAIAVHPRAHSMCSNVITKCFEVLKNELKDKTQKNSKDKKKKVSRNGTSSNIINHAISNNMNEDFSNFQREENFINTHAANNFHSNGEQGEEDTSVGSDQNSLNSHSTEESVEDKTICDMDEISLHEEQDSSLKYPELESVKRNIMSEFLAEENEDDLIQFEESNISASCLQPCLKCDKNLLQCLTCEEMNTALSKFCIHCGEQLQQLCKICNELNVMTAVFCQFCGRKLVLEKEASPSNFAVINEAKKNVEIQTSSFKNDKFIQTSPFKTNKHSSSSNSPIPKQKIPPHSPGRGYWHQQLDFICNNLKSFAYNDLDFRKSISEPTLGAFQTAEVIKNEENVAVTIIFAAFNAGKKSD